MKWIAERHLHWYGAALGLATLLYILGMTFLFVPAAIVSLALGAYTPSAFRSLMARGLFASVLFMVIVNVAAHINFFLLPSQGFGSLAAITALLTFGVLLVLPNKDSGPIQAWTRDDAFAALTGGLFAIPGLLLVFGASAATLGALLSTNSVDAVNHFTWLGDMARLEQLNFDLEIYYTRGFHITTVFIQDSFGIALDSMSWLSMTRLYYLYYIVLTSMLLGGLYYVAREVTVRLKANIGDVHRASLALSLGLIVGGLYGVSFVFHGFVNFLFIALSFIFAASFLLEKESRGDTAAAVIARAAGFVGLSLGATINWPLFLPVIFIGTLLYLWQKRTIIWPITPSLLHLVLAGAGMAHIIPVYVQQTYYSGDGAELLISAPGGFANNHAFVATVAIGILFWLLFAEDVRGGFRAMLRASIAPLVLVVLALATTQYIQHAELRYFSIKLMLIAEVLIVSIGLAVFISRKYKLLKKLDLFSSVLLLPAFSTFLVMGALSVTGNPLHDVRNIFRDISNVNHPGYYETNTVKLQQLRADGLVRPVNTVTVHILENGEYVSPGEQFFWSNLAEHVAKPQDYSHTCAMRAVDAPSTEAFISIVRECAEFVRSRGDTYYIVSEDKNRAQLIEVFGDVAEVY